MIIEALKTLATQIAFIAVIFATARAAAVWS